MRATGSDNWRSEPRIGFGFVVGAGKDAVGQYTNVLISVQSVASTGASATSTTSDYVIDTAHWYRFRVKAKPTGGKFTVKVYDQGAAKPVAADVDGSLVATFEDLTLPVMTDPTKAGAWNDSNLAASRFYFLKLWHGDADGSNMRLVRNFRLVKLTNGLVVLWDFVENKPYVAKSTAAPYYDTTFPVVGPDGAKIALGSTIFIR